MLVSHTKIDKRWLLKDIIPIFGNVTGQICILIENDGNARFHGGYMFWNKVKNWTTDFDKTARVYID